MHRLSILLASAIVLLGCNRNAVYEQYHHLDNSWNRNDTLKFSFKQPDTTKTYDLFLMVRNNHNYPFSNLFVILSLENPTGAIAIDTLEYEMAFPDGRWMGTGFSDIKESKLWYKENLSFLDSGTYRLNAVQAMRRLGEKEGLDLLEGVLDVGIKLEEHTNPTEN